MPDVRYYLDAMVLIHFDNNCLLGALREFAEKTHARLLTTRTVLGETESPKHKMSAPFSDMLTDGAIEVVDDVPPAVDRADAEIETLTADLGPGENSLIRLVARDSEAPGKPILVLNDGKAFGRSGEIGVGAILEADYLALLVGEGTVTCSDALVALENMLAKNLSKRRRGAWQAA